MIITFILKFTLRSSIIAGQIWNRRACKQVLDDHLYDTDDSFFLQPKTQMYPFAICKLTSRLHKSFIFSLM